MVRRDTLGATGTAVAAIALAVLLGHLGGQVGASPDQRIPVSDDTYTATDVPTTATGDRSELVAGGTGGAARVTYLKFTVGPLRGGREPARAEIRLTSRGTALPGHIELTRVPSNTWRESSVTDRSAPRLGAVVATAAPRPVDPGVAFDVTDEIRGPGTYSFAVTVPGGDTLARFAAKEGVRPAEALAQPTLWLSWLGAHGGRAPGVPTAGAPGAPTAGAPGAPAAAAPGGSGAPTPTATPTPSGSPTPSTPSPSTTPHPTATPSVDPTTPPTLTPTPTVTPTPTPTVTPTGPVGPSVTPGPTATGPPGDPDCVVGAKLVPTCGVLWGVAPGAHTGTPRTTALREFELKTGRPQAIYHAYHRGTEIFPTAEEIAIARDPRTPRLLFLNWKPQGVSWARIAAGDPATDAYLDRLAAHLRTNFPEQFFFTVHHEPEDDVRPEPGSGYTADDYAAMFRHVVTRLRDAGATGIVATLVHMAYVPWNVQPWFPDLYPGDDVVDWIAWDAYAYSDPGYGHGDFAELMNRRSGQHPSWPGFYNWAAARYPDKPLMLSEWGVWHSDRNPGHKAEFYRSVGNQMRLFPRVKAMVYFDTPRNQQGYDSRVDSSPFALVAYRALGRQTQFQVDVRPR
ncbi:DNRLRE domain-containing protein [Polymorphospora rubra]|uniref:CBM96 family carbohydrate-binding protein n=1 Tax=Polymorphospora rubra TaxID=338584 RepID=UPI0033C22C48